MYEQIIQDIVVSRQSAENEFISEIKAKKELLASHEELLREGFIAGFYEAYNKLKELNKVNRRIKSRNKIKS